MYEIEQYVKMVEEGRQNSARHGWGYPEILKDRKQLAWKVEARITEFYCQTGITRFVPGSFWHMPTVDATPEEQLAICMHLAREGTFRMEPMVELHDRPPQLCFHLTEETQRVWAKEFERFTPVREAFFEATRLVSQPAWKVRLWRLRQRLTRFMATKIHLAFSARTEAPPRTYLLDIMSVR